MRTSFDGDRMSIDIIRAEHLTKSYLLTHRSRDRYTTLRDALADGIGNLVRKLVLPGSVTPSRVRETVETFLALRDVSFRVRQGERLGIIGRNGAGKTTLLKILSRITEPTGGQVAIRGRVASLLEVGTGFHPELTGRENIYLNGAILGMSKEEISRKFDEIVEFAEVERFLDTPVKRYSSGMYVRLAFAVAAHLEPDILIVDEVLAVGDAPFQKKCMGKMKEAGKEGRTVLFVSHNLTAIRTLCDRAILLEHGNLIADSDPSAVIARYTNEEAGVVFAREWPEERTAPQNASAVLKSISLCDDRGSPLGVLSTDAGFNVEVAYRVKQDGASVGLTLILHDGADTCVFCSISNHEPNWYGKPMPAGTYKSVCRIPPNLLNNGWFRIGLNLFAKGFTDVQFVRDAVRFEVQDGLFVRNDFFGEYSGCIRPHLSWETTPVGTGEGKRD